MSLYDGGLYKSGAHNKLALELYCYSDPEKGINYHKVYGSHISTAYDTIDIRTLNWAGEVNSALIGPAFIPTSKDVHITWMTGNNDSVMSSSLPIDASFAAFMNGTYNPEFPDEKIFGRNPEMASQLDRMDTWNLFMFGANKHGNAALRFLTKKNTIEAESSTSVVSYNQNVTVLNFHQNGRSHDSNSNTQNGSFVIENTGKEQVCIILNGQVKNAAELAEDLRLSWSDHIFGFRQEEIAKVLGVILNICADNIDESGKVITPKPDTALLLRLRPKGLETIFSRNYLYIDIMGEQITYTSSRV